MNEWLNISKALEIISALMGDIGKGKIKSPTCNLQHAKSFQTLGGLPSVMGNKMVLASSNSTLLSYCLGEPKGTAG